MMWKYTLSTSGTSLTWYLSLATSWMYEPLTHSLNFSGPVPMGVALAGLVAKSVPS